MTLPGLLIVALLNPMFNHYGVTMLYYIESSGNWVTLEALVYGIVLGAVMFVVIQWFSCYKQDYDQRQIYLSFWPDHSGTVADSFYGTSFCPSFYRTASYYSKRTEIHGQGYHKRKHFTAGIPWSECDLSILVTWALENAIQTSDPMRSRGYGLHGRTAFSIYRFTKRDKIIGVIMAGLFAVIVDRLCAWCCFCNKT